MLNAYLSRWVRERDSDLGKALAAVDAICDTGAFDEAESSLEVRLLEPGTRNSCGSWFADLWRVPHVYGPDDDRPEVKVASARSLRASDDPAGMPEAVRRLARRLWRMANAAAEAADRRACEASDDLGDAMAVAAKCNAAAAQFDLDKVGADGLDPDDDAQCPFLLKKLSIIRTVSRISEARPYPT